MLSGRLDEAVSVIHEFPMHPPLLTSVLSLLDMEVMGRGNVEKFVEVLMTSFGLRKNQVDNILLCTYIRAGQGDRACDLLHVRLLECLQHGAVRYNTIISLQQEEFELDAKNLASFARLESQQGKVIAYLIRKLCHCLSVHFRWSV